MTAPIFIRTGVRIKRHQYDAYRKVRNEMQQLMKAQKNMELYFAEDKDDLRPQHTRWTNTVEDSSHWGGVLGVFLYRGQQFLTVFCEGDGLQDGAQRSPQWSRLKTTAHRKQKRNTLTCQSAVENHLILGKIDKVKKKPVSILTLHKEYGIVIKHKINYSSSA